MFTRTPKAHVAKENLVANRPFSKARKIPIHRKHIKLKQAAKSLFLVILTIITTNIQAAQYKLDPTHSFINFKISHLGYSWLIGRFNQLDGEFTYDPKALQTTQIKISIDTNSLDSNHTERNSHIKGEKYLDVATYPQAIFHSTGFAGDASGGILSGELELHGVKQQISFPIKKIGAGPDPWGGHRAGFEGSVTIKRTDFGMKSNLGPLANKVYLELFIEGIRL
ncbi:MAG: YceI family protein [Pseudomonadales bacterium]|nr:YceI family protein [Pseudomonadales bacterium]